ncbi:hypothetical protein M9H77_36735 [Catharanthus roseus]|uniref:Uncharacterized protein n=1 Tax=Catharanthus roseus TaxID=4058 RepID=A0ACB9ZTJ4_CATRO|nr:hypothetical protein M9H77_36735 [Catharanthus roseus]
MDAYNFQPLHGVGESYIPTTKSPLDGKFLSIPCSLVYTSRLKQYLDFLNDVRPKIYKVQGSLELSFFRVIVIIRLRLTRNDIISVRSVNLIVVVIDVTVQHRRMKYEDVKNFVN